MKKLVIGALLLFAATSSFAATFQAQYYAGATPASLDQAKAFGLTRTSGSDIKLLTASSLTPGARLRIATQAADEVTDYIFYTGKSLGSSQGYLSSIKLDSNTIELLENLNLAKSNRVYTSKGRTAGFIGFTLSLGGIIPADQLGKVRNILAGNSFLNKQLIIKNNKLIAKP